MKSFITTDGKDKVTRISRWIKIQTKYNANKRNSLYDYVVDENGYKSYQDNFNPENGTYLDYFRFNGKTYALDQFYRMGCMYLSMSPYEFIDTDGKSTFIGAMDMDGDLYINRNTLYLELDDCGEYVRLYNVEHIR